MDVEKTIREYLKNIVHMSLATCADNKPWVCEVHFAYDDDLNIYFRSLPSRRHSQEIAKNPNVAGDIVEQHDLSMRPRGVYYEGRAEMLKDVDINSSAFRALSDRIGTGEAEIEEAKTADGHKFYKISVSDFYLFDSRESKPSQKYHLEWNK
ncbi:MAG TPA: pyridoxamine 5'-phosphate oxidase family protein [Candidatus Saccharimonadales bacterium]|nr:pyridoxamine 5'-phosphate oxidase family protein [Candidatus Saccharimonadales bacterium]